MNAIEVAQRYDNARDCHDARLSLPSLKGCGRAFPTFSSELISIGETAKWLGRLSMVVAGPNGQATCFGKHYNREEQLLMKPQSQSSKSTIHSEEPPTPPLGRVSANSWRVSEKTVTIDEFIEDQRRHLDSIDLCMLGAFSNRLRDKLKRTNADEYPGLREAVHVIVQVLESPAAQYAKEPLPRWLAETAFAANYFLKGFDLIPDHLPEIGLADDALILQRVIERNQSELHGLLPEYIDVAAGNSRKVALQHRTVKTN